MALKIFSDRMSQPCRAVILFCKINRIEFEEVKIDIAKRQHLTPEYKEINPLQKVPAIIDGRLKLYESHAIFIYLAGSFPAVADHWYPADVSKRAKIHSVLDWHHSNLRLGATTYVRNIVLAPVLGLRPNPEAAAEGERLLKSSLLKIESVWLLNGSGNYLLGSRQPSIADISLVCEIMQLEVLEEMDRERILAPYRRVREWITATQNFTNPHFEEVHSILFRAKAKFEKSRAVAAGETRFRGRTALNSKM